ncbi:MAG: FG-GAP repeat domain-containing protein [Candidatus Kryptoniota bacterium]
MFSCLSVLKIFRQRTFFQSLLAFYVCIVVHPSITVAQIHSPVFRAVEIQAALSSFTQIAVGNFNGKTGLAAISNRSKLLYLFEPDSLENLIVSNVVSLPDTPVAISVGKEITGLDGDVVKPANDKIAVLLKSHLVTLVSFESNGNPMLLKPAKTDNFCDRIAAVDMEASGEVDVITYGRFAPGINVNKNIHGVRLQDAIKVKGILSELPLNGLAFADLNGDLVPDLVALDWVSRRFMIFYARGDGTFSQPVVFPLKGEPSALSIADLFENGYPDIIIGYERSPRIDIYSGDGAGRFYFRSSLTAAGPVTSFEIADFTGDGVKDIVAFSKVEHEITAFGFNPLTNRFEYAGTFGTGYGFSSFVPFYFSGRVRADLVGVSTGRNAFKIFKSTFSFIKSPVLLFPVPANPVVMSLCSSDTLGFTVVGCQSGFVTAGVFNIVPPGDVIYQSDFDTESEPGLIAINCRKSLSAVLWYKKADMISYYTLDRTFKKSSKIILQTPFPPLTGKAAWLGDSLVISAVYDNLIDSTLGVSLYRYLAPRNDFIEEVHQFPRLHRTIDLGVTILPEPVLWTVTRLEMDSLSFAARELNSKLSYHINIRGTNVRLFDFLSDTSMLALIGDSTGLKLSRFWINHKKVAYKFLGQFPGEEFNTTIVKVDCMDSVFYAGIFSEEGNVLKLYSLSTDGIKLLRSWHIDFIPSDFAVSGKLRRVFLLNKSEAWIAVYSF